VDSHGGLRAKVVNPETKVELRFLDVPLDAFMHPYLLLVNNALLVEDVLKCQEEGFDAVVLAAAIDPALDESRAAAIIPVVGSLESAMAASQFIGRRWESLVFGLHTLASLTRISEDMVSRANDRQPPCATLDLDYKPFMRALDGDGDEFITRFERVGRELINEGADVLISACQWFGAAFYRLGYTGVKDLGVPLIECSGAGLKMAESIASLARSIGLRKSENPFSPIS